MYGTLSINYLSDTSKPRFIEGAELEIYNLITLKAAGSDPAPAPATNF